jgi:hypothetical protein
MSEVQCQNFDLFRMIFSRTWVCTLTFASVWGQTSKMSKELYAHFGWDMNWQVATAPGSESRGFKPHQHGRFCGFYLDNEDVDCKLYFISKVTIHLKNNLDNFIQFTCLWQIVRALLFSSLNSEISYKTCFLFLPKLSYVPEPANPFLHKLGRLVPETFFTSFANELA